MSEKSTTFVHYDLHPIDGGHIKPTDMKYNESKYGVYVRSINSNGRHPTNEISIENVNTISLVDGKMVIEDRDGNKLEATRIRFAKQSIFNVDTD